MMKHATAPGLIVNFLRTVLSIAAQDAILSIALATGDTRQRQTDLLLPI